MRITKNMVVLNTDIQTEERFEFDPEEIALKVCEEVLKQESFPEDAEISLVVTDAEEVHRLNHEFRGIDRTTILSFAGSTGRRMFYLFPDWILRSLPLLKTASMRAASTRIMTV